MTDPEPPVRVRPATPADRDQVWPLARDLATSYVPERPAFGAFGNLHRALRDRRPRGGQQVRQR